MWLHLMNGGGLCISKYVYLSMWAEVGERGAVVLVAFNMKQFDFDRKGGDKTLDSLDDVIVRLYITERGSSIVWVVGKIVEDRFVVDGNGEERSRSRRWVLVGV